MQEEAEMGMIMRGADVILSMLFSENSAVKITLLSESIRASGRT